MYTLLGIFSTFGFMRIAFARRFITNFVRRLTSNLNNTVTILTSRFHFNFFTSAPVYSRTGVFIYYSFFARRSHCKGRMFELSNVPKSFGRLGFLDRSVRK